ncbi:non-ribosomal peptide synthetase [Enhygromyxa salina]|uniref:Non-ribosomal peptide synthetase n=1 Tax=Enhygromyxa salina TaxID=215803 RepID=A0A0C2CZW2_9BACT|nr:amino acid adenylation domain-containing protein [Enhygromyxa salina]KIG13412.1 non-ribosomal peptide synthetase [Enhygromyxa salina]
MNLATLVIEAAQRTPHAIAVVGPDAQLSYTQLDEQAARLATALANAGVVASDRVALWLPKSARAVVAMQATLRLGAVYVPIDPESPPARACKIIADCTARCLVIDEHRASPLSGESATSVAVVRASDPAHTQAHTQARALPPVDLHPEQLAYILYTSGSTGTPKGVALSHRAALAFVSWAHAALAAAPSDHFSSHAPFHFDLSVLDLYVAFMAGARVCLIPAGLAYAPAQLVAFIRKHAITIWYSVPSALIMMMDHGGLLELESPPSRIVFAGEPFPIKHLRRLREQFSAVRLLNFYGPTETNVCTYHEVLTIDPARATPVPIGRACCADEAWAINADGEVAKPGETGELMVRGPTVMTGYWGRPPLGTHPYATGDIVRVLEDGVYEYVGRRDHMVKVRGMRIEIGEVEAALLEHPAINQVAVIVAGVALEARLVAFVCGPQRVSLLALKRHCAERLPRYMQVDEVRNLDQLPRTGNGKIDRKRLLESTKSQDKAHH